jgi:hypothetical protein
MKLCFLIQSVLGICVALFSALNGSCLENNSQQWTWLHRKQFTVAEQQENRLKKDITLTKVNLKPFTQLIFSWNSVRPEQGNFIFYARVRNATTKEWSKWHRMIVWGGTVQKSFKTNPDHISSYHHVRLESHSDITADAFGIKIIANGDADLSLIKSFAVNLANFNLFVAESESVFAKTPSVLVKGVPRLSQFEVDHPRNDGLCSPTSCTMLTSYLMAQQVDPVEFAEKSFDHGLGQHGSWPFNMAHAYELSEGKILFAVARMNSFLNLCDFLKRGIPVVVSVRGPLPGAPRAYQNGHLLVVVGFDSKTKEVICNDPAVAQAKLGRKRYHLKNFLHAWERSHRLAYIAEPIA